MPTGSLLPLPAVIASAGVVSDSTATVIGAMIVAPLMTPILGIVLAVVLTDGANELDGFAGPAGPEQRAFCYGKPGAIRAQVVDRVVTGPAE